MYKEKRVWVDFQTGGDVTDIAGARSKPASSLTSLVANPAPPRPSTLGVAVLQTLIDNIVGGEIAPGSSLPTNPELCTAFGVSRTVVRESLKLLEEKGLIRVRQGQGTTVAPTSQWNLLDPLVLEAAIRFDEKLEIIDDVVDVRVGLESLMARRTAHKITDEELGELREALLVLESLLDQPDEYLLADIEFHDVILRSSGNRLGRSIIRTVHPYARASTRYNPHMRLAEIALSHEGHLSIFEAISSHDEDRAFVAMHDHIMSGWLRRKKTLSGEDQVQ
jgi:DNA-binding FadR family transcriptional regulator